ncbi:molybdate ABC transporter substrate-binding protein [Paenarthrobacter aurescens]|nr:molybdate ABC transporter substrate-binding protein [Paenarthrobacter aurescens]MDO6144939.1 molybdate ABC transporter substrate-binding protein [Paenarthrobacter aurescens]MDO6148784.1 molybdate ABC transporter substrate-binding protein [Paenarthrobacter aurescens]MDO6160030.1 molybdate ABC transporter substrate-binding protein [Paenarthrobacter aurescens]MDO6163889.1 molybdate ABC transporter substrate-binding protein [Paenarthrobacter aurescens]
MRNFRNRVTNSVVAGALAIGLAGSFTACASGTTRPATGSPSPGSSMSGEITVFAAASLKTTFTQLAKDFEVQHPGTKVTLSFAGSSDLVTQITQGAPADVFASADAKNMNKLADQGLVESAATNFATNVLEIAVPPGNPASISSFADLAKPGVKVVTCASQVPCGAATEAVEKAAGTTLKPVSEESSVTDVLGKVTSGEADAGLVYVTDVRGAGDKVVGIPFPESDKAVNTYPIATVGPSKNKELAAAFIANVTSEAGKKVLRDAGFGTP